MWLRSSTDGSSSGSPRDMMVAASRALAPQSPPHASAMAMRDRQLSAARLRSGTSGSRFSAVIRDQRQIRLRISSSWAAIAPSRSSKRFSVRVSALHRDDDRAIQDGQRQRGTADGRYGHRREGGEGDHALPRPARYQSSAPVPAVECDAISRKPGGDSVLSGRTIGPASPQIRPSSSSGGRCSKAAISRFVVRSVHRCKRTFRHTANVSRSIPIGSPVL